MLKNLIIIGARGFGREALWLAKNLWYKGIRVKGFLDDDNTLFDGLRGHFPPILSSVEDYQVHHNDYFFCALGDPDQRKKYCDIIREKGGKFLSLISPKADVSPSAQIGDGCFIDTYSVISDNVSIGDNTIVMRSATIGHDAVVSEYVTVGAYVFCGGGAKIGPLTTLHPHSVICRKTSIGEGVVVGAGSVVINKVKDRNHVFGAPAKNISLFDC